MSVEAISWVLTESDTGGTGKILLIGIANWVDQSGRTFVGIRKLAGYARRDERNVRRHLQGLVDEHHLGVYNRETDEPLERVPTRGMVWELCGWAARAKPRVQRAKPRGRTSISDPLLDPPPEALELPFGEEEESTTARDERVAAAAWLEARRRLAVRVGPPLKYPERRWLTKTFHEVLGEMGPILEGLALTNTAASAADLCGWATTPAPRPPTQARPLGCEACTGGFVDLGGDTVARCPTCHDLPIPSATLHS